MSEILKILILEDSPADAEMVQRQLKKDELHCEFRLAINKETYLKALDEFRPDLVLSDHSLPQFSSSDALIAARTQFPDIPFIMVTGTVSEEFAAQIMKMGADDYILKDRLTRLPSAINSTLQRRRSEKEKHEAEKKIISSESNLRAIFENASEGFVLLDRLGMVKALNNKAAEYPFFNTNKRLEVGDLLYDFIAPLRIPVFKAFIAKVLTGENVYYDISYDVENGPKVWIDFSITPVWENQQVTGICITGRDITERKKVEEEMIAMEKKILEQKIEQQRKISRAIIKAEEAEKNRIGQELHDNINQILAGTKMFLVMAGKKSAETKTLLEYPLELLDNSIQEIRLLSQKQVTPLKNINLKELIENILTDFSETTKTTSSLKYGVPGDTLSDDIKLTLYRIVQEQVTNIYKHARAKHIEIEIAAADDAVNMQIRDDGVGFVLTKKRKGIGISNMTDRVASFNGSLEIKSSHGEGCLLNITIPCR